jgi:hypothetical protein
MEEPISLAGHVKNAKYNAKYTINKGETYKIPMRVIE